MARHKDGDWRLPEDKCGLDWVHVPVALLMDIRDELKRLNTLMHCHNTMAIPELLRAIKRNTTKPKKRVRKP